MDKFGQRYPIHNFLYLREQCIVHSNLILFTTSEV